MGKEYVEIFEQIEVVRISNFIRINKEKMHADSLNLRIAKENNERKLEDQGKSNYAEERLLQSKSHFK